MEYRIWWKEKDGGRYATERELQFIYIEASGTVDRFEWHGDWYNFADITDQVVVEFETYKKDSKRKLIFEGDKLVLDNDSDLNKNYIIRRNTDGVLMSVCLSDNACSIPLSCCCVGLMKIVGTIHDEHDTEGKV